MEGEIGDAAGMIWQYLNEHGQTTLGKLRQGTKLSDQLPLVGVKVSIVRSIALRLPQAHERCPGISTRDGEIYDTE
jgi:hypothetical protein